MATQTIERGSEMSELMKRLQAAADEVASWPAWKRGAAESEMGQCRFCRDGVEHVHGEFDEERSAQ
jgi:hypothetical protein